MASGLEEARALWREAREHKRLASHHRLLALRTIGEIEALCRRYGFAFELVKTEGVDDSHGRQNDSRPLDA